MILNEFKNGNTNPISSFQLEGIIYVYISATYYMNLPLKKPNRRRELKLLSLLFFYIIYAIKLMTRVCR